MSSYTEVKRTYAALLGTPAIRQVVFPAAGQGVLCTANVAGDTYGIWVDVVLLAGITVETLIVGVALETPSAVDLYTVDIGSCEGFAAAVNLNAGGAPAIAAAHRAEVRSWFHRSTSTSPGAGTGAASDVIANVVAAAVSPTQDIKYPIYIPPGVGIVARCYGHTAAAVTIRVSISCVQGF